VRTALDGIPTSVSRLLRDERKQAHHRTLDPDQLSTENARDDAAALLEP
jgi:hypothetical protein